jgi:hypothetical protein
MTDEASHPQLPQQFDRCSLRIGARRVDPFDFTERWQQLHELTDVRKPALQRKDSQAMSPATNIGKRRQRVQ